MATIAPYINFVAPEALPPRGGLYTAATVVERPGPVRLAGGLNLISTNCGESGINLIDCGPETDPPGGVLYEGDSRGMGQTFDAVEVWAADECALGTSDEEAAARANHLLALTERTNVERHVATLLADRAGVLDTAVGADLEKRIKDAVGRIEGILGSLSLPGVLHAPARLALAIKSAGAATFQGNQAYSPLGHRWVFGGGYDAMTDAIYVTGPVTVLRSPVFTSLPGRDLKKNERLTVASREVVVGWECITSGINVGGA